MEIAESSRPVRIRLHDEYKGGCSQAQESGDGREDVAERQPLLGQACLHRRSSDFASKPQGTRRPEKVVMASQQLQMIIQPLRSPSVTEGPTMQEGRGLPDGQV